MLNYLFCDKYYFKKFWENKHKTNDLTEIPKSFPAYLLFLILFARESLFKISIHDTVQIAFIS